MVLLISATDTTAKIPAKASITKLMDASFWFIKSTSDCW